MEGSPFWQKYKYNFPYTNEGRPPVFSHFVSADFSTFEGWRDFVEKYGLEGFEEFDQELKQELDQRLKAFKKSNDYEPLNEALLKNVWKRILGRISVEQENLRNFFDFQQKLHETGKVNVAYSNFQVSPDEKGWTHEGLLFEAFGDLELILPHLNKVSFNWDINTTPIDARLWHLARVNPKKSSQTLVKEEMKDVFRTSWDYGKSLLGRCYAEIVWLIIDGKTVKNCALCKKPFIPDRSDAEYCDGVFWTARNKAEFERLPRSAINSGLLDKAINQEKKKCEQALKDSDEKEKIDRWYDRKDEFLQGVRSVEEMIWAGSFNFDDVASESFANDIQNEAAREYLKSYFYQWHNQKLRMDFYDRYACKKVGPRLRYQTSLSKEERKYRAEYKRLYARLSYIKKKKGEESPEYKKELRAWNRFRKDHRDLDRRSKKKVAKG